MPNTVTGVCSYRGYDVCPAGHEATMTFTTGNLKHKELNGSIACSQRVDSGGSSDEASSSEGTRALTYPAGSAHIPGRPAEGLHRARLCSLVWCSSARARRAPWNRLPGMCTLA